MSCTVFRFLIFMALVVLPLPAHAAVNYSVYAGFYPANFFYLSDGDTIPPVGVDSFEFSYGGALCPAPGTPNYLCARVHAAAGNNGGRIFLRAGSRMKRTNAQFTQEHGAYAGGRVDIYPVGGYVSGPAPGAYFVFGLSGTIRSATNNAGVTVNSYASANLYAGSGGGVQCFGSMGCPPNGRQTFKVTGWDPTTGFSLDLRSDVKMFNPSLLTGWDGDGEADFYDTLELLSIQLVDENDQPMPGVTLTFTDGNGQMVVIPSTPPDPAATATPALPVPTPTATPSCANPPCEDCENCIDDDHDGLLDRVDDDCAPPANGVGLGLPDSAAAKALDKCAKALRKGGAKLTAIKVGRLQACLKAVTDCVQLKAADASCLAGAQTKCTKARSALVDAEATLTEAVTKTCGEPAVAANALAVATGLGFAGEAVPCGRRGVGSLATVVDVAECVRRQHGCAAERIVGFAVPRAGELLGFGGWDVGELPCLQAFGGGGGAAIGAAKQKAIRKCDVALQKGTAKLASGRFKVVQACAAAIFACAQTKPGDAACIAKAAPKCAQGFAGLPRLRASFAATIAKACGGAPLEIADLRAPAGLGLGALDTACVAIGAVSPASVDDLASCLERHLACRVDQALENEIPRLAELLQAAGVSLD